MFIKKLKVGIFLSLLSIFLHSCFPEDCASSYKYIIENKTNSDFKVNFQYCQVDSVTCLKKNTTEVFYESECLDGNMGFFAKDCPDPYVEMFKINSIGITMNDTMDTKINYSVYKNWSFTIKGDTGIFKISLSDSDFVKKAKE